MFSGEIMVSLWFSYILLGSITIFPMVSLGSLTQRPKKPTPRSPSTWPSVWATPPWRSSWRRWWKKMGRLPWKIGKSTLKTPWNIMISPWNQVILTDCDVEKWFSETLDIVYEHMLILQWSSFVSFFQSLFCTIVHEQVLILGRKMWGNHVLDLFGMFTEKTPRAWIYLTRHTLW